MTAEPEVNAAEPIEGDTDEPQIGDSAIEDGESGAEEGQQSTEAGAEEGQQDDGKSLPADLRNLIKHIRETDKTPAASKLVSRIRNLYFGDRAFRSEFPGGLKEAREFKQQMEEVGGAEAIAAMAQERAEWEHLDEQFSSGDPEFVRGIAEQSPEAFVSLVPAVLETAAKINPEFHSSLVANIVSRTLEGAGLGNHLYLLNEMMAMKNYDRAAEMVQQLAQWTKQTLESGRNAPQVKRPEQKTPDAREQQLAEREQKLFNQEVGTQYDRFRAPLMKAEMAKYPRFKEADNLTAQTAQKEILALIAQRSDADPAFLARFDRYYAARDSQGLLKLAQSQFKALLPDAVRRVHAKMSRNVGNGRSQQAAKPQQRTAQAPQQVSTAWTKVSSVPRPDDVDRMRTTREMIFSESAVLKNGRRVYWGNSAPSR